MLPRRACGLMASAQSSRRFRRLAYLVGRAYDRRCSRSGVRRRRPEDKRARDLLQRFVVIAIAVPFWRCEVAVLVIVVVGLRWWRWCLLRLGAVLGQGCPSCRCRPCPPLAFSRHDDVRFRRRFGRHYPDRGSPAMPTMPAKCRPPPSFAAARHEHRCGRGILVSRPAPPRRGRPRGRDV